MGSNRVRVAVVGGGRMGLQHARVCRASDRAELVAVVDPSESAREAAMQALPGIATFEGLADLVAARDMDVAAVHICTPPWTHYEVALAALEAGWNVFVEKPFTDTRSEAERLFTLARSEGVSLCAGHQLLREPAYEDLQRLLPALRDIVHIESYFSFSPSRATPSGAPGLSLEDQLYDILPHPTYLLLSALDLAAPGQPMTVESVRHGVSGTVHALVGRGRVTGTLTVTLAGRPVESWLRVVGTNGEVTADFVRGIVRSQIGGGASTIDKILGPYQQSWQIGTRTTRRLFERVFRRQRSYPSLTLLIDAWHQSILEGTAAPVDEQSILETVGVCEHIRAAAPVSSSGGAEARGSGPGVVMTGGTGWLGTAIARRLLEEGVRVTVLSRRDPAPWARLDGVEYVRQDVSQPFSLHDHSDASCIIHCAAETAGGWDAHERNSIGAARSVITAAREAGIPRLVHVSSLAVLQSGRGTLDEGTPLDPQPRMCGPYAWGKIESEKIVAQAAAEGLDVRIVRPAAIIDEAAFDPPGKLGRRIGPLFVAVGGKKERLAVVDLADTARAIVWAALRPEEMPPVVNLIAPEAPTRRELVAALRAANPTAHVIWLPRPMLWILGPTLVAVQKVLRPRKPAINLKKIYARQKFATDASRDLFARIPHAPTGTDVAPAGQQEQRALVT